MHPGILQDIRLVMDSEGLEVEEVESVLALDSAELAWGLEMVLVLGLGEAAWDLTLGGTHHSSKDPGNPVLHTTHRNKSGVVSRTLNQGIRLDET